MLDYVTYLHTSHGHEDPGPGARQHLVHVAVEHQAEDDLQAEDEHAEPQVGVHDVGVAPGGPEQPEQGEGGEGGAEGGEEDGRVEERVQQHVEVVTVQRLPAQPKHQHNHPAHLRVVRKVEMRKSFTRNYE